VPAENGLTICHGYLTAAAQPALLRGPAPFAHADITVEGDRGL
jgi:hypothetical protein